VAHSLVIWQLVRPHRCFKSDFPPHCKQHRLTGFGSVVAKILGVFSIVLEPTPLELARPPISVSFAQPPKLLGFSHHQDTNSLLQVVTTCMKLFPQWRRTRFSSRVWRCAHCPVAAGAVGGFFGLFQPPPHSSVDHRILPLSISLHRSGDTV
jgi:hypothetical protein